MAGFLGALFGVVSGLTGRDVERRAVPNQGIRQSAANVPVFALIGMMVVGVPYGMINLSAAALLTQTVPDPADWLRLGLGSGLVFGVMEDCFPVRLAFSTSPSDSCCGAAGSLRGTIHGSWITPQKECCCSGLVDVIGSSTSCSETMSPG